MYCDIILAPRITKKTTFKLFSRVFRLINAIEPGSVKKINTMNAPFKQVTACNMNCSLF